jgi:peptidoglycan/LPS O-acetylase OafA/YrhL
VSAPYQADAQKDYRPDIDGLRAIAILSVACYHAGFRFCSGGFAGVDVFFVISGYLIGGHIYEELRAERFSFLRFYQRRAKRILPALYAVLIAILLASTLLLSPSELVNGIIGKCSLATTLSVSNIVFWRNQGYFAPATELNPLLMTWSLGVEEQFYLIIPLLMLALSRVRKRWLSWLLVLLCVISFALACFGLPRDAMAVFYLLPGRAWELGVGVLCAILAAQGSFGRMENRGAVSQWVGAASLAAIVIPMGLLSARVPFPGVSAVPCVLGTAASVVASGSWVNRRVLSAPPLVYIGRVSYSWYLWHWPVLAFARIVRGRPLSLMEGVGAITLAFVAAVLSYYFVEQPFRRSTLAPRPLLMRYALGSLALGLVCGALWVSGGMPARYPKLAQVEKVTEGDLDADPCLLAAQAVMPSLDAKCYEQTQSGRLIAIWGDSHAAAIARELRSIAHREGYGMVEVVKSSCPPLLGTTRLFLHDPKHAKECTAFNQNALALMARDPKIKVVALEATWARLLADFARAAEGNTMQQGSGILSESLRRTVSALRASGKKVVIFEDVPHFEPDPMWQIRTREIPARRWLASAMGGAEEIDPGWMQASSRAEDGEADAVMKKIAGESGDVETYDLKQAVCRMPDETCRYRTESEMLFMDPHHLSAQGAEVALEKFVIPTAQVENVH